MFSQTHLIIILLHFAQGVAEAKCILVTRVCMFVCVYVSVSLSVPRHIPTLMHGPGYNLEEW